jgi:hypothetical protein
MARDPCGVAGAWFTRGPNFVVCNVIAARNDGSNRSYSGQTSSSSQAITISVSAGMPAAMTWDATQTAGPKNLASGVRQIAVVTPV